MIKKILIASAIFISASSLYYFSINKDIEISSKKKPKVFLVGKYTKEFAENFDYDKFVRELKASQRASAKNSQVSFIQNVKELGPFNMGGRTRALMFDITNPLRILAGGASGGLWESLDRGKTWNPINDLESNLGVTFISQSRINPDIIYYSTGEPEGNSGSIFGEGVFKSVDGGKTFTHLKDSKKGEVDLRIWRVVASRVNEQEVYIATKGKGLFRSTDGGEIFEQVFDAQEVTDIEVFDDGKIIIGVSGVGLYVSQSGDLGSFTKITKGLPTAPLKRIEIAYCDSFPEHVYAQFMETNNTLKGIYYSSDGGENWSDIPFPNGINYELGYYAFVLEVHPLEPTWIYSGSVNLGYTQNQGGRWKPGGNNASDFHVIGFPSDIATYDSMFVGNDGGVFEYSEEPRFFKSSNKGYRVSQFYALDYFPTGEKIFGGTQDQGSVTGNSDSTNFTFLHPYSDGGYTAINPNNTSIAYISDIYGAISKTNNANDESPIFIPATSGMDIDNEGAWFTNPLEMNRDDPSQMYTVTYDRVYRTKNADGDVSSPPVWSAITNDLKGSITHGPKVIGIGPGSNPTIYIGGPKKFFMRIDNAATATPGSEMDLRPRVINSLSESYFSCLTVNPNDESQVFLALSDYSLNVAPRVFRINKANTSSPSFQSIVGDLDENLPVNWIVVSAQDSRYLVIGTDFGLYASSNGGKNWHFVDDMPTVPIHQIRLRQSDQKLFIATHGRGVWTADLNVLVSSIADNSEMFNFDIYPNPTTNKLIIKNSSDLNLRKAEIFDVSGVKVFNNEFSEELDVKNLKNGTYILKISNDKNEFSVKKFVKTD